MPEKIEHLASTGNYNNDKLVKTMINLARIVNVLIMNPLQSVCSNFSNSACWFEAGNAFTTQHKMYPKISRLLL